MIKFIGVVWWSLNGFEFCIRFAMEGKSQNSLGSGHGCPLRMMCKTLPYHSLQLDLGIKIKTNNFTIKIQELFV